MAEGATIGQAAGPLLTFDDAGNLLGIAGCDVGVRNNGEVRFYDNGNYVGFEAPPLLADQIWVEVIISAIATYIAKLRGFDFRAKDRPCFVA